MPASPTNRLPILLGLPAGSRQYGSALDRRVASANFVVRIVLVLITREMIPPRRKAKCAGLRRFYMHETNASVYDSCCCKTRRLQFRYPTRRRLREQVVANERRRGGMLPWSTRVWTRHRLRFALTVKSRLNNLGTPPRRAHSSQGNGSVARPAET